jgi:hypothetical protein
VDDFTSGIAGVPRTVPGSLKWGIFFSSPLAFIGLVFFLFGSIFPVVFGAQSDFTSPLRFSDSDPAVPGRLIARVATGASSNKQRIYDYHYQYVVDGQALEGHSFDTLESREPGDDVLVQYVSGKPSLSRIAGMRAAPFGWWVALMTAIFPALGLGMLYYTIKRYRTNLHLVTNGIVATGTVTRKEATSTTINKQRVFKVFFRFKASDGREHEASVHSHQPHNLGDELHEPLVYDPADPARAVLLDTLPAKVRQQLAPGR